MGKMLTALLLVLAIELAMAFFVFPDVGAPNPTALTDFIRNLENWSSTSFLSYLINSFTVLGGTAIIVGTFFTKQDWLWRAGMLVACFFTFGSVIFKFGVFLGGGLSYIGSADAISLVVATLVGFLGLYFVMVSIDFISGKD